MFRRTKALAIKLWENGWIVEFVVGGVNFSAGTSAFSNAFQNYLAFEMSLRLAGICILLLFLGSVLAILQIFPHPDFVEKHANFLNTYFGRSILYACIALISPDNIKTAPGHRWYAYLTWLSTFTLGQSSLQFLVYGLINAFWFPLPVCKSMTTTVAAAKAAEVKRLKALAKEQGVSLKEDKNEVGWTMSHSNERDIDGNDSVYKQSIDENHSKSPAYGDQFDPTSVDQSGWTTTHHHHHRESSTPSYFSPRRHQMKLPPMLKSEGSTYSIDMTEDSYAHQQYSTNDSSSQLQHKWTKTPSPSRSDKLLRKLQQRTSRRIAYNREVSSTQIHQLPFLGYNNSVSTPGSVKMYGSPHVKTFNEEDNSITDQGWTLNDGGKSKDVSRSKNHKRVFVPDIGSFDLSSGGESQAEDFNPALVEVQQDGDNDSVYSLDSDVDVGKTGSEVKAKMGRKLTRNETRIYRAKLDRGMQRALSQRAKLQVRDTTGFL